MLWNVEPDLDLLNKMSHNTLVEHLGIRFTKVGNDFLQASMPVDHRTVQPYRLLHGGASVVLAETLGSIASHLIVADQKIKVVGLEINANHLKSAHEGEQVVGKAKPIRIGKRIHVWQIEIKNEKEQLICISRLTVSILN